MSIIEILWGNENATLMQILTILVILDYITGVCIAIRLNAYAGPKLHLDRW